MYLGAKLCKTRSQNGILAWAMSHVKYVQEAIRNCAVHLGANCGGRFRLPKKAKYPFKMGYDPKLYTSPELDPDKVYYYLTDISVVRWIVELGRIEIITKVLLLSSLVAAVHVMAHVGQR